MRKTDDEQAEIEAAKERLRRFGKPRDGQTRSGIDVVLLLAACLLFHDLRQGGKSTSMSNRFCPSFCPIRVDWLGILWSHGDLNPKFNHAMVA
jgi:hypothetical protein